MAKCVSVSGEVTAIKNQDGEIAVTQEWSILTVNLTAGVSGVNTLKVGGANGMRVDAGDAIGPLLIAPGTQIRVSTTHTSDVAWGYQLTTFPGTDLINAILSLSEFFADLKAKEAEKKTKEPKDDEKG